jgi:hypothetical protein
MFARAAARAEELRSVTSALAKRIQRLEQEHRQLRARLEADRELRISTASIAAAAQAGPMIGTAFEAFAQAMRAPSPHGRAGGIARARTAWRYFDGTFMPESEKFEAYRLDYERYAAGGRARAMRAARRPDGKFMPDC